MRNLLAFPLVLALAACGPASISGQVGGNAIDSSDAIASKGSVFGFDVLSVVIGGDTQDLCQDFSQGVLHKGASLMRLSIASDNLVAGAQYSIKGISVTASASKLDTACGDVLKKNATGGTISIAKLDGTTVEGSFDLTFDSDRVTGSFSARLCSDTSVDLKTCQ